MEKEKQILDEVEKTLQAFDNDIILEENPFLFTRIKAEVENRLHKQRKGFAIRLSLNKVLLMLILLINLITLVYYFEWNTKQSLHVKLVSELKEDFQIDQTQNNF